MFPAQDLYIYLEKLVPIILISDIYISIPAMKPISKITNRLYLTNAKSVAKVSSLTKLEIKYVLTVMIEPLPLEVVSTISDNNILVEYIPFAEHSDVPLEELQRILESIASKINDHVQQHPMIIHCALGQNRSPAAVLYWLIFYKGMTFKAALKYLESKRHVLIEPSWLRKIKKMAKIARHVVSE